jgi:DNA-binding GntR family transcriptional regulator
MDLWKHHRKNVSAADAVYTTLREAILRGVIQAGDRLGEIQFAKVFRTSRTPAREALLRLESEGLATRVGSRGLTVGHLAPKQILDVYPVRELLYGLAARLAAQSLLPAELAQLVWMNEAMRAAVERGDYSELFRLNLEFHEAICVASRNNLLLQFTRHIHDWSRRFRETTVSFPGRGTETLKEHEALLKALDNHDPAEADRLAREHVRLALQARVRMLQSSDHW